ncbi:unnamed protein product [Cuscuta epithymum]|uniref:GAG-pre-integrase domain-containing protein n=1 Tax=Cuscuta epithymum TaxID=186058 RepID=A0AAV0G3J9_9ASTE|nr:unnamed protein product [Cuscuta epithymum]
MVPLQLKPSRSSIIPKAVAARQLLCLVSLPSNGTPCIPCLVTRSLLTIAWPDRPSRRLIGTGERRNGLYYLREEPMAHILAVKESNNVVVELWHQGLGHPASQVVENLAPVRGLKNIGNFPCDICFRAKQTREPFPISLNKPKDIFEMVHCDLWD